MFHIPSALVRVFLSKPFLRKGNSPQAWSDCTAKYAEGKRQRLSSVFYFEGHVSAQDGRVSASERPFLSGNAVCSDGFVFAKLRKE